MQHPDEQRAGAETQAVMSVRVFGHVRVVVYVRVYVLAPAVAVRVQVDAPAARELSQRVRAECDQHEADRELKRPLDSLAHADVKHYDGDARREERERVA